MKIRIASYKKAQVFKRDYVRQNGKFIKLEKCSGNHSYADLELNEGEEFDARGSVYREGVTKWNAVNCQSWAKFTVRDGKLIAMNFDGREIPCPDWCRVIDASEEESVGEECKTLTA